MFGTNLIAVIGLSVWAGIGFEKAIDGAVVPDERFVVELLGAGLECSW